MSHIFTSFGRRSMLILFVVGRGCGGLAPTVFSRIIICSMCVGKTECMCVCCVLAIYGLQLFACCAGIALSLATLASFMSWLVLLFNWQVLCALKNCLTCRARQWLMTMRAGAAVGVCVGACHTAMARILHKSLSVYNLLFLCHPAHTDTTIQTHVHLPHTSID